MAQYRKRPVVIEAIQWRPLIQAAAVDMRAFLGNQFNNHGGILRIATLEGTMEAHEGDWIIRGVAGEFYPCKPDIFANLYDKVIEDSTTKAE